MVTSVSHAVKRDILVLRKVPQTWYNEKKSEERDDKRGAAAVTNIEAYTVQRRPEIGRRIREARLKKGWTQARTAKHLGCSRRRMNRVERGITDFSVFELELLAQAFDVPVVFFLER